MASTAELSLLITAKETASAALDKVTGGIKGVDSSAPPALAKIRDLGGGIAELGKVAVIGAAAGLAALGAAAVASVVSVEGLGESTLKLMRETGDTAEQASGLLAVFSKYGMSSDDASRALGAFSKHIGGLQSDEDLLMPTSKSFNQTMKDLGINFQDASGAALPMNDVLLKVADKFAGLADGATKTDLAMTMFGKSGKDMIPVLNLGAQGMQDAMATAQKYGLVLSGDNVEAIHKFGLAQKDLTAATGGLAVQLGSQLLPAITPIITAFTKGLPAAIEILKPAFTSVGDMLTKLSSGDFKGAFTDMLATVVTVGGQLATKLIEWGKTLWSWVKPMIPPLLVELGKLGVQLLKWIGDEIPPLLAQLGEWGAELWKWVEPMIPPLLVEAGKLADQLLAWIGAEIPPLLTKLGEWGREFWAWVEPMIPPLLVEAGKLAAKFLDWITAEGPPLATKFLTEWLPAIIEWVVQAAIDILPKLVELVAAIGGWIIGTGVPKLLEFALKMGEAIVTGMVQGLGDLAGALGNAIGNALNSIDITIGIFHIHGGSFDVNWPHISAPNVSGGGGSAAAAPPPGGYGRPGIDNVVQTGANAGGTSFWRGGPTWVGEQGPEIVNLPRGSSVTPNNAIGGSDRPINITLQIDSRTIAQIVTTEQGYLRTVGA
jgi:hypothetical protein